MSDDTYNGWANKFTWLVCLWLDNDQGAQEMALELAADKQSDMAAGEAIEAWLEEQREDQADTLNAGARNGLNVDMLETAFAFVDWRAVGRHYRDKSEEMKAYA